MRWIILCLSFLAANINAATWPAASTSLADVQSAVALAADGDTVTIPAGSSSWTNHLDIAIGITLQGAGNDTTVILDDVPRNNSNGEIIGFTVTSNQVPRMTGITFRNGSLTTTGDGAIHVGGICLQFRIDNCHFDSLFTAHNIQFFGWIQGVVDHNIFDIRASGGGASASTFMENFNNGVSGWSSWAAPSAWGTAGFLFFETNTILNHSLNSPNRGSFDVARGGRMVFRYNTCSNLNLFDHGSDSGAGGVNYRGTRATEIYNNTFFSNIPTMSAGQIRSGPVILHHNIYTGPFNGTLALRSYRLFSGGAGQALGSWGSAANGTNDWDYNATEPDGSHIDGHPGYSFATGTHIGANSPANGVTVVTVAGTPWTNDQWAGYQITNTKTNSPYFNGTAHISASTSNTLTLVNIQDTPPLPKFQSNDTFVIRKVLIVLDQPCRGQSDLLPSPPPALPVWTHQRLEPSYAWDNLHNGSSEGFAQDDAQNNLRINVDYFHAIMPGYTPFIYPHPLVSGSPVTNATLVVASQNPTSTALIIVSPSDLNGNSDGNTIFSRLYTTNIVVTLTAPASVTTTIFQKWQKDGIDWSTNLSTAITMDTSHTMTAIYVGTGSPPVAAFHGSPTSGGIPLLVTFADDTGNATSWLWNFGNGDVSTLQNPTEVYSNVGIYNITLTVANATGTNTLTKTNYVTATAAPLMGGTLRRKSFLLLP